MRDILQLVRANILAMKPYSSARDKYNDGILLDANESTLSAFDERDSPLRIYPDPAQKILRNKIAGLHGLTMENVTAGNGSDEIIDLAVRLFCEGGVHNVIIPEPTYGMYETICNIQNIEIRSVLLNDDFEPDADAILRCCDENTRIIFLCSPNNPTGNTIRKEIVLQLLENSSCIIILDEAYADYSDGEGYISLLGEYNNLLIVRTFSKAWGLAGLRCGYALASAEITELLLKIKMPYNLNYYTQQVISEAVNRKTEKDKRVALCIAAREQIAVELQKIRGIQKVYPSASNFILFRCEGSRGLFAYLLKKGIIIRDRSTQPLLENCLRVTVGTEKENELFLQSVKEFFD